MSVYSVHAWYSQRPDEDVESLGTGVTDNCEHYVGDGSNLGPLEELSVLLNS